MKIKLACIPCALGSLVKLVQNGVIPVEKQEIAMRSLLKHLATLDFTQSPPLLGKEIHRIIREIINNPDPYKDLKEKFNSEMLKHYSKFKKQVNASSNPFDTALRLAIAGNIIDFGPSHDFEVMSTIDRVLNDSFAIDDSKILQKEISQAKSILYLGDNAGEIVMDRLFLETIQQGDAPHPKVYFGVRGAPIINDVTQADAIRVGIDNLAEVISNGDSAPSTILPDTSKSFQAVFNSVDLIIAKGQGNFEGLTDCKRTVYCLLMVKCEVVSQLIGVPQGSFVVIRREPSKGQF